MPPSSLALDTEGTLLALRTTAMLSSMAFVAAYASAARAPWWAFVAAHSVHLSFVLWFTLGLAHPTDTFALTTGGLGYAVLYGMAAREWRVPGSLQKMALGLHYLWLMLTATYAMNFFAHLPGRVRVHSALGMLSLIGAAVFRFVRRRERSSSPSRRQAAR